MAAISDVCGSVWVSAGVCEVCIVCAEVCAVCAVSVCECVLLPFVDKSQALSTIDLPKPSKTKTKNSEHLSTAASCNAGKRRKPPAPRPPTS